MATRKSSRPKAPRKSKKSTASTKSSSLLQSELSLIKNYPVAAGASLLGLIIALLLAFPFRSLVVPAIVNGKPIFSWKYVNELHKTAGQQVLDRMISEILVEQEVAKQGIQVTQDEINQQISQIEEQFGEESGGLETVLSLQGLTRDEFVKQLRLNLSLEKLVKGTIEISEEDIAEELTTNAEIYQDLSEIDAATTAAENLRSGRLQDSFQGWFQDIRNNANIKNFFQAGASPVTPGAAQ